MVMISLDIMVAANMVTANMVANIMVANIMVAIMKIALFLKNFYIIKEIYIIF